MYDFAIVGGGIVGVSVGKAILEKFPCSQIALFEKENELASHQTGHNSGVIHSGIYYEPGSYKAIFAKNGNASMKKFCDEHGICYKSCGKIIVAAEKKEIPLLNNLYERGLQNKLKVEKLNQTELLDVEPYVRGVAGLRVPETGVVDYKVVTDKIGELIKEQGGHLYFNTAVEDINETENEVVIHTNTGKKRARYLINCGGLYSDKIAKRTGYKTDMKIVPFRGEYYRISASKNHLVKNLIYPVPNPKFPFLGVHLSRQITGEVDVGPNAILSLKREGYKKFSVNFKELSEILTYGGFWKLAGKFGKEAVTEYYRSFNKTQFTKELKKLVPAITKKDLTISNPGVRAQALNENGSLVDDFKIINGKRSLHICNAPSPAATAALEIGKEVVNKIDLQTI